MSAHTERIADLLQQVRAVRSTVERRASAEPHSKGSPGYEPLLIALLDEYLASPAMSERVIAYASAAELGVVVAPPKDAVTFFCNQESPELRILFWATWKRMVDMERQRRSFRRASK